MNLRSYNMIFKYIYIYTYHGTSYASYAIYLYIYIYICIHIVYTYISTDYHSGGHCWTSLVVATWLHQPTLDRPKATFFHKFGMFNWVLEHTCTKHTKHSCWSCLFVGSEETKHISLPRTAFGSSAQLMVHGYERMTCTAGAVPGSRFTTLS